MRHSIGGALRNRSESLKSMCLRMVGTRTPRSLQSQATDLPQRRLETKSKAMTLPSSSPSRETVSTPPSVPSRRFGNLTRGSPFTHYFSIAARRRSFKGHPAHLRFGRTIYAGKNNKVSQRGPGISFPPLTAVTASWPIPTPCSQCLTLKTQ